MRHIVKSRPHGDLGDGIVCCQQITLGVRDTDISQILLEGPPRDSAELLGEMAVAHA